MRFYNRDSEEQASLLSVFDCFLNGTKALYASSELTTGKRLYDLMAEAGVRTEEELRAALGEEGCRRRLLEPNLAEALDFARQLRERHRGELVLTPAPFVAPGWSQEEYLALWETLIRTRVEELFFGPDWEYSNGCVFEFSVAWDQGLPTRDAEGDLISLETGIERISVAAAELEARGFDSSELRLGLRRLTLGMLPSTIMAMGTGAPEQPAAEPGAAVQYGLAALARRVLPQARSPIPIRSGKS